VKPARVLALVNLRWPTDISPALCQETSLLAALHRDSRGRWSGNPQTCRRFVAALLPPTFFIPPVPDYPSTLAVLGAAAAEVLISNFGDHVHFDLTSTSLPGMVRPTAVSPLRRGRWRVPRVWRHHFMHAVDDGFKQGKGIGHSISQLLPRGSLMNSDTSWEL
jgi:hypothetical protein